jgi:hypothetical protein
VQVKKFRIQYFIIGMGYIGKSKTAPGVFLPVKVTSSPSKEQLTIIGANGIKVQLPLTNQSIEFVKQLLQG